MGRKENGRRKWREREKREGGQLGARNTVWMWARKRGTTDDQGMAVLKVDDQLAEITLKIPYFPYEKRLVVEDKIDLVFSIDS